MKRHPSNLEALDRHGWLLWLGAFVLIVALAGTVHLLHLRLVGVLIERGVSVDWLVDGYYTGVALAGLASLFILYTVLKQRQLQRVRRLLLAEETELENTRARLSEISSLFEVTTSLNLQLSVDTMLDIIVRRVIAALKAQQASVMLFNPKTKMLETSASYGVETEWVSNAKQPIGEGIAGRVAETQQGLLLDSTREDEPDLAKLYRRTRNISSALSVPLMVENRCVGVLNVNRINHPNPFNENQRQILQIFAEHVGAVLSRAEAIEELGQKAQTLELANAKLSEMNRMKDVFLSTASHELKTPLTTVIAYAELLNDHDGNLAQEQRRDFVGRLRAEAERLLSLIDDILDLTRLETGKLSLKCREASISTLAREAVDTTRHLAEKTGVRIEEEYASDLQSIDLDPIKIRQVIVNLLVNAIRFSPAGGEVRVRSFQEEEFVGVEVSDQGPGVAPEDISQIFGLFGQGVRRPQKQEGLGIGLHLVKRIVELHGGTVGVRSQARRGSTFWVRLPRVLTMAGEDIEENAA